MNALDILFLINKHEGEITNYLIKKRKELLQIHGVIRTWTKLDPEIDHAGVQKLHRRVKELRREMSSLLNVTRMDKKYG